MTTIATVNPATGRKEQTFAPFDAAEIDQRLERAAKAFEFYRKTSSAERAAWVGQAAEVLDSHAEELARLISREMGKLIQGARDEIRKCAWTCRYFAEHGPAFLEREEAKIDGARAWVRFDPLGPVLAVMPWNFPFWQVFRFAVPALVAGNVVLLKHASNVPQCALAIESVFAASGLPRDVFQTLLIGSDQVSRIVDDDRVAAITLTGSLEAGRSVARDAGRNIKKVVLELGGSDPFIVMPASGLERTVRAAIEARIMNSGQSCVAAKRFILVGEIADAFEERFTSAMRALKVGDPLDPTTQLGPLASEELLHRLDEQVRRSKEQGARLLTGGMRLDRPGAYYAPTVLAQIPRESPAQREELFGPVASLFRARDAAQAIQIANETEFGLGASVWTEDEKDIELFSSELQAGNVFFNQKVASDPRVPFGGIKRSGFGRELSRFGIREFVDIKTVWVHGEESRGGQAGQPDSGEIE